MSSVPPEAPSRSREGPRLVGRYALYDKIASGGMASVHFARLVGPLGFTRVVAVKRLHPQFAKDPEFVAMLLDEARLAARVRHPNVVPTIDVVATDGELFLVMEYVQGESLGKLIIAASERKETIAPKIAITISIQALWGLHAAHEARTPRGASLGIIHRDVSPQNILVGDDGVVRIVDFGVAKAAWRAQSTRDGQLKGKIAYMPPEQLRSEPNQDRRVDVYAASVCLWEALTGRRYVDNDVPTVMIRKLLAHTPEPPSKYARGLPRAIDAIVLKGLASNPAERFATAYDMATELERAAVMASAREVGDWVRRAVGDVLERRAKVLFDIEGVSSVSEGDFVQGAREAGRSGAPASPEAIGSTTAEVRVPGAEARVPSTTDAIAPAPRDTDTTESVAQPPSAVLADAEAVEASAAALAVAPRSLHARRWIAGVVGLGAATLVVWALWARTPISSQALRASPASPAASVVPNERLAPAPSASTAAMAPPEEPGPASVPAPTTAAFELPSPRAPPEPVTSRAPVVAVSPRPRPNCHPPYTLDSEGVRIPKRECLHP